MSVWCRCGSKAPSGALSPAWEAQHGGSAVPNARGTGFTMVKPPGHRVVFDRYRAGCVPYLLGCRQCGEMPEGRKEFYCSDKCKTRFEADHFWDTARRSCIDRASSYRIDRYQYEPHRRRDKTFCQRCFAVIGATWRDWAEVNHIVPVNGQRENFGCSNHQDNLEALCHPCHVEATGAQRLAGLLGGRTMTMKAKGVSAP